MNESVTITDPLDDPALLTSDLQAVQHFAETGEPVAPEVAARIWDI